MQTKVSAVCSYDTVIACVVFELSWCIFAASSTSDRHSSSPRVSLTVINEINLSFGYHIPCI